jgi:CheY-like chemotaxis protein
MKDSQEFLIYLMGLSDRDAQVLKRVLSVTGGSKRSYKISNNPTPETNKIYIVASDSDEYIKKWSQRYLDDHNNPAVPTIFAGNRMVKGEHISNISLPVRATQLLNALDTITINELNYIPELTIGGVADESGLSHSVLEEIINLKKPENNFNALVVDDSLPVRKQMEMELRMLGAKVFLAESGEQAIELSSMYDFDIIFLDVVMPGIDGYKVCKILKKDIKSKKIPIVMLTGKSSPFDKVKGTLSGCDTYLTKPLEHKEFQNVTKKYLPVVEDTIGA